MANRTPQEVNDRLNLLIKDEEVLKVWNYWKNKYSKVMDPDDVDSIIGVALMKAVKKHDDGRQLFISSFVTYLGWEMNRELSNFFKKKKEITTQALHQNIEDSEPDRELSTVNKAKLEACSDWMHKYLASETSSVIDRVYLKGYTEKQVAEEDGCSVSAVKRKLSYGIKKLRDIAEKRG